ncbi:hypothetical protein BOTBODRAFT_150651 [Botryobasidium botryosum FD-172 SS1]|uniref:CCHC-type domain-containing protein n=1 Tax=Botryobasidium botryosum (strain FD-172 SS1) TaxID=930990 RepID=A0A067N134_BOTB1|nr:hypothetical protein BOTBODRAFT_150651 [Botryobasidium botryosum FD-172 SS1]
MTRLTNFGMKRTYLQAGFGNDPPAEPANGHATVDNHAEDAQDGSTAKKKRRIKRAKKLDLDLKDEGEISKNQAGGSSEAKKRFKRKDKRDRVTASEERRQRRIAGRNASTTCFACREKGHSAKDCPSAVKVEEGKSIVGMCYRCGSSRHSLSRCKKPSDPLNPLPFASCFVCSGTGHLASSCPKNAARGIYPNGGCCKLCGETSHLAKDCGLRKNAPIIQPLLLVPEGAAGADEDDFHTLSRRRVVVDKEEKVERKLSRCTRSDTTIAGLNTSRIRNAAVIKPKTKIVSF